MSFLRSMLALTWDTELLAVPVFLTQVSKG